MTEQDEVESRKVWQAIGQLQGDVNGLQRSFRWLQHTVLRQGNRIVAILERRTSKRDGALGGAATLLLTVLIYVVAHYLGVKLPPP